MEKSFLVIKMKSNVSTEETIFKTPTGSLAAGKENIFGFSELYVL